MEPYSEPKKSPRRSQSAKINLRTQLEYMMHNAVVMTEMGMELKEKTVAGEKYIAYLRTLSVRAGKTMTALQSTSRNALQYAQKLVTSVLMNIDSMPDLASTNTRFEFEKLLLIIEKELNYNDDMDSSETISGTISMWNILEKIKYLETKHKCSDNTLVLPSNSTKSVKSDIDEKYPENLSRDSLIDLDNVVNLPTVPEDIFTGFPSKPARTSSLSSLKSMRKVKLSLQRASNNPSDDEDDGSEPDDHEYSKPSGDNEDVKSSSTLYSSLKKLCLGNITEETQD